MWLKIMNELLINKFTLKDKLELKK